MERKQRTAPATEIYVTYPKKSKNPIAKPIIATKRYSNLYGESEINNLFPKMSKQIYKITIKIPIACVSIGGRGGVSGRNGGSSAGDNVNTGPPKPKTSI
ncbi:hypothetical protein BCE02nite_47440 [Brevibacillus centrosporus]|nr:hypothetical protein BCE02nite_47440 [Brevibacillus centrosporus]